jgi:nucleoside 2-deoxyribosyltransferase
MAKRLYVAGELFSFHHLAGNAMLASAIEQLSDNAYQCILPQALEQRETTPEAIRNQDLREVILSDVCLFFFDGTELDSGTVVEFMLAKFADIPSVVVRSDFRKGGDAESYPWNLMVSFYPRTKVILIDSIRQYQEKLRSGTDRSAKASVRAVDAAIEQTAKEILSAFEEVENTPPLLKGSERESVESWLSKFAGESFSKLMNSR